MKKKTIKTLTGAFVASTLMVYVGALSSCSDVIDTSNLVTKTEATIYDYLDSVENYSDYLALLSEVRTGSSSNTSSLASLMQSYGNYTVFPFDNEALATYTYETTNGETSDWQQLSDDEKILIAYNSIIDCGDDDAYITADFPTSGSFSDMTLDDRLLTCELGDDNVFVIEGMARVTNPNNELKNGCIHGVDAVISPSQASVSDLIGEADNMKVMSLLLQKTGWADSLSIAYEDPDFSVEGYAEEATYQSDIDPLEIVDTRYRGFTVFVEPDSIYALSVADGGWGLNIEYDEEGELLNAESLLAEIQEKCAETYTDATNLTDYTAADNPVNRFVAYHIIDGAMAYNKLVMHMNEYGYSYGSDPTDPQLTTLSIDVWEYYVTKGQTRCLLKVTQNGELEDGEYPIYLNTQRDYDNSRWGTYQVTSYNIRGQKISSTNGSNSNSALNGFYYPIDGILLYSDDVKLKVLSGRLRFDIASMTPEIATSNARGRTRCYLANTYFANIINVTDETQLFYLKQPSSGEMWYDYQGDEFMALGVYDLTFRLPPVPTAGTYELRMGCSFNSLRGMAQIYFGDNASNMSPAGLPIDMRIINPSNIGRWSDFKDDYPEIYASIPWEIEADDEETNTSIEKGLRNANYMKGPKYFDGSDDDRTAFENNCCLRRIITQSYMSPDKTYYVRYKSALEQTDAQFFLDYFELCPKDVYNGVEAEDVW